MVYKTKYSFLIHSQNPISDKSRIRENEPLSWSFGSEFRRMVACIFASGLNNKWQNARSAIWLANTPIFPQSDRASFLWRLANGQNWQRKKKIVTRFCLCKYTKKILWLKCAICFGSNSRKGDFKSYCRVRVVTSSTEKGGCTRWCKCGGVSWLKRYKAVDAGSAV